MSPYKITLPDGTTTEARRVTEVIRAGMPRLALHEWELRGVAEFARSQGGQFGDIRQLIAAWRKANSGAANRGTAVHKWIAATLTGALTPALLSSQAGYKLAWTNWWADCDLAPEHQTHGDVLVEQTLCSADRTIAGTADLIWGSTLIDWKTVEKNPDAAPWPDHLAQMGAYSTMPYVVDPNGRATEWAPEIEEARIVRLCSDGTYHEHVLTGDDLLRAQALWEAVQYVAGFDHHKTANQERTQKERR